MQVKKNRILMLMTGFPYPATSGGQLRDLNIIKSVSEDFEIHLLVLESSTINESALSDLKRYCEAIEVIYHNYNNSFLLYLKSIVSRIPYRILQYSSPAYKERIEELLSSGRFALIFCDQIYLTRNLPQNIKIPVIPHCEDAFSFLFKQTASNGPFIRRLYSTFQWRMFLKYELNEYQKYGIFIAVSEEERKRIIEFLPDIKIPVIENGVDLSFFSPDNSKSPDIKSLIFVGLMDSFPNIDAIEYFINEIYPMIIKKQKDIKVYIVGKNPVEKIRNYHIDDKIIVTGAVDDIREYVNRCGIYIVPLRFGTGTRLKILEAMAMGKAIVSSSIGCEGIDVKNGEDILIADSPEEFAGKVIELVNNPELAHLIGQKALESVKKYDWKEIGFKLKRFLFSLLEK